jgi:hypothetical protein
MRGTGIANSFRSRVCSRRCSAGILSERGGAWAGEENEGRYGRCDVAMHDALLTFSRMEDPSLKATRYAEHGAEDPTHVIEDECSS